VGEIRDGLAAIYGPLPLPEVVEYLGDLERIGVLQRETLQREKAPHAP
jgi:predicted transcriptional regulator